ncbi:MAG: CT253 family lipoprotein [Chlamydiia bacterium]
MGAFRGWFSVACCALVSVAPMGCQQRYSEFTTHHDDGRVKPVVALLQVRDRSGDQVGWDLSRELSHEIRRRLLETGDLYIVKEDGMPSMENISLFGPDMTWSKAYRPSEFVVALELVEHKRELYDGSQTARTALDTRETVGGAGYLVNCKVRVRVIDVRGADPRLAYQEIVQLQHRAPSNEARVDYMNVAYGSWSFNHSALATAHNKLVEAVVQRLDHYVLLEKANAPR